MDTSKKKKNQPKTLHESVKTFKPDERGFTKFSSFPDQIFIAYSGFAQFYMSLKWSHCDLTWLFLGRPSGLAVLCL